MHVSVNTTGTFRFMDAGTAGTFLSLILNATIHLVHRLPCSSYQSVLLCMRLSIVSGPQKWTGNVYESFLAFGSIRNSYCLVMGAKYAKLTWLQYHNVLIGQSKTDYALIHRVRRWDKMATVKGADSVRVEIFSSTSIKHRNISWTMFGKFSMMMDTVNIVIYLVL